MTGYQQSFGARGGGWPSRRPGFLLVVAVALLAGFYALGRPRLERALAERQPLVGQPWIVDGDSIRLGGRSIRLDGIDAPEWDQTCLDASGRTWRCGQAASRALREHIGGRTVSCRPRALDRYGRTIAVCALGDGSDVNAWMVREGHAIAYGFAGTYAAEQSEAKAARRGIWDGTFVSPANWRHQKGDQARRHAW